MQKTLPHPISGNEPLSPAEEFILMSQWCKSNDIQHDIYGSGQLLENFEAKIAAILGFPAACFVPSGTLAQSIALELACQNSSTKLVAMHPSSHILSSEGQGFQLHSPFKILPLPAGPLQDPYRPWGLEHLQEFSDPLSAVLYELPMRELGGQTPSWEDLQEIKDYCHSKSIHLHMDGARLWQLAPYYQRSYAEIASGFDSVYVSLYKDLSALGGSLLAGSEPFIAQARTHIHRRGGKLFHYSPFVVSAMRQLEQRLAQFPALFQRCTEVYQLLNDFPLLQANPKNPQSCMLHLHWPCSVEVLSIVVELCKVELDYNLGRPRYSELPQKSWLEWQVGDTLLAMSNEELTAILRFALEKMAELQTS